MDEIRTSGEWEQERLWVLRSLDELKRDFRQQAEQSAVMRQAVVEKAQRDIGVAHDKIRKLEETRTSLRLKNWAMTALLSGAGVIIFEIVKNLLHGSKP